MKTSLKLLTTGILILALAAGINAALAKSDNVAANTASPIHPTFAMLDSNGTNVLESGQAASTMQTCGQCHDTEFIVSHAYHADLGLSDYNVSDESWNTSNGLFGKFDPITYRYLSPAGDERLDLTTPDWLKTYGWRVPGGGPAVNARDGQPLIGLSPDANNPETSAYNAETGSFEAWDWSQSGVIEMNCFLCHMETPNNEMRVDTIASGDFAWANSATLYGTGIIKRSSLGIEGFAWNTEAFDANGELKAEYVKLQDPTNANCAACHGEIHEDPIAPLQLDACDVKQTQTATTGQVISSQKISESGINLSGKADFSYAWDIHAERALMCTDCHYSLNNPAHALDEKAANPSHLTYDPRKLDIGEYLQKPNHDFARGDSAQFTVSPESRSTMRRCDSCHDTAAAHAGFLPYNDRHMQVVACETCHVPQMYAPAIRTVDWTAVNVDGSALTGCRGIEGDDTTTDLVTGYQPVLMQRTDVDGKTLLAPYNLVTSFFWVYEDSSGNLRPVRKADLEAAYLAEGGAYAPDILAAFDANSDGELSEGELELNSTEKQDLVDGKLSALGLNNVRIYGQVQPYSINHNVVSGEYATRECTTCHNEDSRVNAAITLTGSGPTGVTPEFVTDTNVAFSGSIVNTDGTLMYQPASENDGVYIFGHNRIGWIDWFGALAFLGTLVGVAGHGTMRYLASRKHKHEAAVKPVYMYDVYERFWHWLQTIGIVTLLLTGLIIHRPDLFGAFSFRNMVTVHNVLAALLAINAVLSLFWHLVSGEIRQYLPHPRGFVDDAITQALYYIKGIFKREPHPFEKTKDRKLNPLQQVTYFGLLNVLLPLQGLTGILMWLVQKFPVIQTSLGGLPFLAPFHTLTAWLFATFIVGHVYLTTTAGPKPLDGIQAMITGWEDMEVHENSEQ